MSSLAIRNVSSSGCYSPIVMADKRGSIEKIFHEVIAFIKGIVALLYCSLLRVAFIIKPSLLPEYVNASQSRTLAWKEKSSSLHIMVHGFFSHPIEWLSCAKQLRRKDAAADIRVPLIPRQGNCSLEEAVSAVRPTLVSYLEKEIQTKQNTTIPIFLYGFSNGGRIVLKLLQELQGSSLEKRLSEKGLKLVVKTHCIAGLLEGTSTFFFRMADRYRLSFLSPDVISEFPYQSGCSQKLMNFVRNIQNTAHKQFSFYMYASTEDKVICPYVSSLPTLGLGETHVVVHHESHHSILHRVWPMVLSYNEVA